VLPAQPILIIDLTFPARDRGHRIDRRWQGQGGRRGPARRPNCRKRLSFICPSSNSKS
jgi:hypothetical protein